MIADTKHLTTLFLDAGGVLVDPNWERVATVLARHGVPVDAARLAAAEPHAKLELDVPAVIRATDDRSRSGSYFELVLRHAGSSAPAERLVGAWAELDEYHRRTNLWETVLPGVPAALDRLRARGLRLVVVSNSNGTLRDKLARLELLRRVDLVIDSHEVGVEKPDPRIFSIALERAGARREETIHVGDYYEIDVVGARAAGIGSVLIDPQGLCAGRDCARVRSVAELVEQLGTGPLVPPSS